MFLLLSLLSIPDILDQIHTEFLIALTELQQAVSSRLALQFIDIVLLKMLAKRLHPFLFVLSSKSILKSWKSMPLNWADIQTWDWFHHLFVQILKDTSKSQMSWSRLLIQQNTKKWLHQMIANLYSPFIMRDGTVIVEKGERGVKVKEERKEWNRKRQTESQKKF